MERRNLRLTMRHRLRFAEANASAIMPGNGNQSNALALSRQNLMKKSMLLLVALLIFTSVVLKAQSPQKINFQSIVRNTSGVIVSNKSVKFKITILADSATGEPVYSETHLKTTDAIGLVSLQIGSGTVSNGVFSSLNWGNASHFIKLEADFTGGNTYVTLGTQELMSVPYAMYAAKTDTASLNLTNRFAEKAPVNNPEFTGTVYGIDKAMVGLGNVDNTSDAGKPVSSATQTALNEKAPIKNPEFTGTVYGIDKTMVGLDNVDNTSDASKPVSSATQTALNEKAPVNNPTFTGTVGGITKAMVGLGNVDNTSDASKPVSLATQKALNDKAPINNPEFTGTVYGITKAMVGLGNVDNTSDASKPVSASTQTALNEKAPIKNPEFTGTVYGITQTMVGLGNVDNTSDASKPVSSATQTALNAKAPINSPTFTGIVGGITKATVGLDNVDNTSDKDKPVSIPTQAELIKKLNATDTSLLNLSSRLAAKLNVTDFPSGSNVGDFMYWNGTKWVGLAPGMVGQILLISSTGTPTWGCPITNSAGTPSTTPTLTVNTSLTPIKIATTGATGIAQITEGLPPGVTATWSANEITISGTPTDTGSFTYKIPLTGGCGMASATGTITVTCVTKSAAAPSTSPSLVVNTALTNITIATTGATGIDTTGSGLPNGVTATWSADVITISGTPTAAGTFEYTIPLTGGCGTVSATGTITVTTVPSVCPTATITDYNNINTYKTVGIGTQCWMKENLRTRYYNDGTVIPFDASGGASGGGSGKTWGALTSGAHTLYAHDSTPTTGNLAMYGYLYNGYAARGIITNSGTSTKNICPTGWHVPSDSDWKKLVKYIESGVDTTVTSPQSNTADVIMREDNSSGFAALLGGFRDGGGFTAVSTEANFLSTTDRTIPLPGGQSFIYTGYLAVTNGSLLLNGTDRGRGMSIRCLKNSSCTANTAAAPSSSPSLVVNTALTDITIATTGATGIDTTGSGLPNGVTATWSADVITISGTPTASGTFTYTILLTGGCGTVSASGTITVTTATVSACPTATITYNGYTYKTVGIGNQCWMAENLRTRKYNDGTDIPFDASGGTAGNGSGQTWGALSSGAHTLYAHDSTSSPSNLTSYGYLYNWYAVDSKKLCPSGWHVPQFGEWNLLDGYLVGTQGTMKKDDALWLSSNPGTNTNTSGFSALPGGERQFNGSFLNSRKNANFWSASEDPSESYIAWYAYLAEDNNNFTMNIQNFGFGLSVRCLKDSL